jgi:hypothetical protein
MSGSDDEQEALARLQSALERIAEAAAATKPPAEPAPDPRLGEAAGRLDAVIAQLRDALGEG